MATFYARSNLTNWNQVGGWSSTSGGVSNGLAAPSGGDDVVFDANSGSARTIYIPYNPSGTGYYYCNNLTFSGSAAINLAQDPANQAGQNSLLQVAGMNVNLSTAGTVSVNLRLVGDGTTSQVQFTPPTGKINLNLYCGVNVLGNLVASSISSQVGSVNTTTTFGANNVTTDYLRLENTSNTSHVFNMGSGTWTIKPASQSNADIFYVNPNLGSYQVQGGNATVIIDGEDIVKTGLTFYQPNTYFLKLTFRRLRNMLSLGSNTAATTLVVEPGVYLKWLSSAAQVLVTNYFITGTASNYITLEGYQNGSPVTFTKQGVQERVFFDYVNFLYCASDVANTFYGRSSTYSGSNPNIAAYTAKQNFVPFF